MFTQDLLSLVTALYAGSSALRLLAYLPQIVAIARDRTGAHAISLLTWTFWGVSHAITAVYSALLLKDTLLVSMMIGNTLGCVAVVWATMMRRWPRRAFAGAAAFNGREPPKR
jgi:hypothetical protein